MSCQVPSFRLILVLSFLMALDGASFAAKPQFSNQTIDQIDIGYGLALGRVDSDDDVDILLADQHHIVWYENPGKDETTSAGDRSDWKKHVMAEQLTPRDHVCIAARDIDGDGLVEVAVGANWNPGETSNRKESGGVFQLNRPSDPRKTWIPHPLTPYDPTTHRMYWFKHDKGFRLAVLPLHGEGNVNGEGAHVAMSVYAPWGHSAGGTVEKLDTHMHLTHNFDLLTDADAESMLVGGKEGIVAVQPDGTVRSLVSSKLSAGVGEVRAFPAQTKASTGMAAIEPMHGTDVVVYLEKNGEWERTVIDRGLGEGHALACAHFWGDDQPQIVAGWRKPDAQGKVGIKLYAWNGAAWESQWVDDSQMACEDLKVVDLDRDGKLDIVAAGRGTKNLVVYWQQ